MSVVEIKVPSVGESITEVTLAKWLKKNGEFVKLDEPICEFESDKATMELPAAASGVITHLVSEGDDLPIGTVIAKIDTAAVPEKPALQAEPAPKVEVKEAPVPTGQTYATGHPSPAAGKILAESGIKSDLVQGTGKDGRITKSDALKAAEEAAPKAEPPVPNKTPAPASKVQLQVSPAFSRADSRKKLSRMRRTIAKRLVSAKNETAMLTTFNEVDMTAVMELRKNYQDRFVAKYGIKLGFMSIFAKACAKALLEMPDVNAMIEGEEIVYHDYADISIAISTPNGLVVPPVLNVESLGYAEIEYKIKELSDKARTGALTIEEMTGGTFTITNGGIFGSLMSTPILNEPQSAILGMHAIKERPIAVNGQVVIRPMMYLALSYDHRVIDGSTSVTFLVRVKELIEDPTALLLGV